MVALTFTFSISVPKGYQLATSTLFAISVFFLAINFRAWEELDNDDKKLFFAYGTEDPFLTEKRVKWCHDVIKEKKLTCQTHTFKGKHEVDKSALKVFVEQFL